MSNRDIFVSMLDNFADVQFVNVAAILKAMKQLIDNTTIESEG